MLDQSRPLILERRERYLVFESIMRTLWAVDHGLRSASKKMQSRIGLTGPQRLTLRIVGRYPRATAGELAEILHLHPSTLTGVLDRLKRAALLRRDSDPTDGRRARFELTEKGRLADRARAGTVEAHVGRVLGDLAPMEVDVTRRVLDRLAAELVEPRRPKIGRRHVRGSRRR